MISHKHQCIFIHIPKTGGKSVKKALFDIPEHGPNSNDWAGVHPSEDLIDPFGHQRLRQYRKLPAYKQYFRFAFVRNPFDRLVSAYFYLHNDGSNRFDAAFNAQFLAGFNGDFKAFVRGFHHEFENHIHFKSQHYWISTFWKKSGMHFLGRFERLIEDLSRVAEQMNIPYAEPVHLNVSKRQAYQSYYDEETRHLVARAYARDLKLFGYSFE